jgi:hypothetical protein
MAQGSGMHSFEIWDDNHMAVARYNRRGYTDSGVSQRFNVIPT